MSESALHEATAAELRLEHAEYFLSQYIHFCGPPIDSYWHMVAYFDAFLFFLASIFELSNENVRRKLKMRDELRFAKVLRNISTHRSILSAPGDKGEYIRPMMRVVGSSIGSRDDSSKLYFNFILLDEILIRYADARSNEKQNVAASRRYIDNLRSRKPNPELGHVMREVLESAKTVVSGT